MRVSFRRSPELHRRLSGDPGTGAARKNSRTAVAEYHSMFLKRLTGKTGGTINPGKEMLPTLLTMTPLILFLNLKSTLMG